MSTAPPPPPAATPRDEEAITIYGHSNLFYWWPVWAISLVLGTLTLLEGNRAVVVPGGSTVHKDASVTLPKDGKTWKTDVVVPPEKGSDSNHLIRDGNGDPVPPLRFISSQKAYGVVFMFVLLCVIFFTSVPLRGMWSLVVFMALVMIVVVIWLADWTGMVLEWIDMLDIRINMGGYMVLGVALLFLWLVSVFFFDRRVYMKFSSRQLKVVEEIGEGEHVYDAVGMKMEKVRSDFFRHIILGLGAGDLIVKTSGTSAHQFEFKNVLFVGSKVARIEQLMREQKVEAT